MDGVKDEDQTSEFLTLNVCDSLDSSLIMKSSDLSGFLEMETGVCFFKWYPVSSKTF